MIALLAAVTIAASPLPSPAYPVSTPPPEPNHLTIDIEQGFLRTSGYEWVSGNGTSANIAARYEFQTTPKTRFANSLHWQRMSSRYLPDGYPNRWWFNYNEFDDQFDVELGRPDLPFGVGVGYYDYATIYDYTNTYNLRGFGLGFDRWANYYMPRSFYYSAWYYPDVRGGQVEAGAYGILRVEAGVNFRPNLTSPWNVRIGFMSDTWFAKNAYATDSGFNGPYVGLSYWK